MKPSLADFQNMQRFADASWFFCAHMDALYELENYKRYERYTPPTTYGSEVQFIAALAASDSLELPERGE